MEKGHTRTLKIMYSIPELSSVDYREGEKAFTEVSAIKVLKLGTIDMVEELYTRR